MLSFGKLPRFRSALLVALPLAVLMPVAAVATTWYKASNIVDNRVSESSGLAIGEAHPGWAYTINDDEPDNKLKVYAIRIKSGSVSGVVTVEKDTENNDITAVDPESVAMDGEGHLWIADTGSDSRDWDGDNVEPPTLYRIDEPAGGEQTVTARRYPIAYAGDSHYNVETLLINPVTHKIFLVRKASVDGKAPNTLLQFTTPWTEWGPSGTTIQPVKKPPVVSSDDRISDGSFTPSGRWAVVRNGGHTAYVLDPSLLGWPVHAKVKGLPDLAQPESLSFDRDGSRFLIGSEGADPYPSHDSPLYWVPFNQSKGTGG